MNLSLTNSVAVTAPRFEVLGGEVREIPFREHRDAIAEMRRQSYTNGLLHELDRFDEEAHHFALIDKTGDITGLVRMLRSDEVARLELQCESDAHDLRFPSEGLIMEFSRGCARKGTANMPILQLSRAMREYAMCNHASHIVSKTGRRLLPLYQVMGFRVFGRPFYSDWFDDRNTGLMSIPIIYDFSPMPKKVPDEEVFVW